MMIFLNNIKLIILVWLLNFFSAAHGKRSDITRGLNCTFTTSENISGTYRNDTKQILVVNRCPKNYENEDIVRKCQDLITFEYPDLQLDYVRPVMSSFTNIAYWNKFCGICNNDEEKDWKLWVDEWTRYASPLDNYCGGYALEIQRSDVDRLNEFIKIFISKGMKLVASQSTSSGRKELECSMEKDWPILLFSQVNPCILNNFINGQHIRLKSCQYAEKSGRTCRIMQIFEEGLGFRYVNSYKDVIYKKWSQLNFSQGQYIVDSGYDNVFYYCERSVTTYKSWAKVFFSIISKIFIFLYFMMDFNKRNFENFSNKIVFSYLLGVIVMYILLTFIYLSFPVPCVTYYLAQFWWFFHVFWTMLIFVEFCYLLYRVSNKSDLNRLAQRIRYLIYCLFGFLVPVVLLAVYYLNVLKADENHCPVVPDHSSVACILPTNSTAEYNANMLAKILYSSYSFSIPVLFSLVSVFVVIYLLKCGSMSTRMAPHVSLLIVLIKMSFIMAFHWILFRIYLEYKRQRDDDDLSADRIQYNMDLICQLSIDFHGIFVFFIFWVKKSMIINNLNKLGCNIKTDSQQNGNYTPGIAEQSHPLSVR